MAKETSKIIKSLNKNLNVIFVALISAFMLIIPFYRGLFFRGNYIPALVFVTFLFTVFVAYKFMDKSYKGLNSYVDIAVLMIPVAYLISYFFAVNAKDALDMFLLYMSYFMLYKLTTELSIKDEKYKNIFINIILLSTFLLSFTAILNAAGILNLKEAFVNRRLFGLYQYPNTSAAVLGVGIILSLNKYMNEGNIKVKAIYQLLLTALLSSFVITLSRGGYLVLAGVLFVNFLVVNAKSKIKMLLGLFTALLSGGLYIYKNFTLPDAGLSKVWIYYMVGIMASALISYFIHSASNKMKFSISDKAINIALISVGVVFIGIAAFILTVKEPIEYRIEHQATQQSSYDYASIILDSLEQNSNYTVEFDVKASSKTNSYGIVVLSVDRADKVTEILKHFDFTGQEYTKKSFSFKTLEDTNTVRILLYNYEAGSYTVYKNVVLRDSNNAVVVRKIKLKYLPEAISERILDINLKTENVSGRMTFAKDGLKIIRDYPIFGAGGGAWANLYRQYQTVPYNTNQTHNFYVQYGTEVGIFGLLVLAALLVMLVIAMIRSIKAGSQYLYVYLAALLLLLHSSIDFDLSLAAVGYMLWMLIGLINSDEEMPNLKTTTNKRALVIAFAASFTILVISSSVFSSMRLGIQGAMAMEKKDMDKAIELCEKAIKLDRYNSDSRFDLSKILNDRLRKTGDVKYLNGFVNQVSMIRKYEPNNHIYTSTLCSMYFAAGKFEEATNLADKKVHDEPLLDQSYMIKIDVNLGIANYFLKNNKIQEAVPYLEKAIEAKDQCDKINKGLKTPIKLQGDYLKKVEAAVRTLDMIKADMK